jgi:hypothetical protein
MEAPPPRIFLDKTHVSVLICRHVLPLLIMPPGACNAPTKMQRCAGSVLPGHQTYYCICRNSTDCSSSSCTQTCACSNDSAGMPPSSIEPCHHMHCICNDLRCPRTLRSRSEDGEQPCDQEHMTIDPAPMDAWSGFAPELGRAPPYVLGTQRSGKTLRSGTQCCVPTTPYVLELCVLMRLS